MHFFSPLNVKVEFPDLSKNAGGMPMHVYSHVITCLLVRGGVAMGQFMNCNYVKKNQKKKPIKIEEGKNRNNFTYLPTAFSIL